MSSAIPHPRACRSRRRRSGGRAWRETVRTRWACRRRPAAVPQHAATCPSPGGRRRSGRDRPGTDRGLVRTELVEDTGQACRTILELSTGRRRPGRRVAGSIAGHRRVQRGRPRRPSDREHAVQRLEPLARPRIRGGPAATRAVLLAQRRTARADADLRRARDRGQGGRVDVRAAAMKDLGVNLAQSGHAQELIEVWRRHSRW